MPMTSTDRRDFDSPRQDNLRVLGGHNTLVELDS